MESKTELSKVDAELSNVDWNEYDIKLTRMQILNAKQRGNRERVERLSAKLESLWRERLR